MDTLYGMICPTVQARSGGPSGDDAMKHFLNVLFISASVLFIIAPALGLGGVVEALMLGAALLVGCLSVVGGLLQAERTLRQIEVDTQPGPRV